MEPQHFGLAAPKTSHLLGSEEEKPLPTPSRCQPLSGAAVTLRAPDSPARAAPAPLRSLCRGPRAAAACQDISPW